MPKLGNLRKYTRKSVVLLKNEGVFALGIKGLTKLQEHKISRDKNSILKKKFISLVDRRNVMDADWSNRPYKATYREHTSPYTICWIMSPPAGGGGHQNIFRFIDYLDKSGMKNKVYLYSTFDDTTPEEAAKNIRSYSNAKNISIEMFKGGVDSKADIVFATGWETAYPVFNTKTDALKFYFVQDFEPLFYPMGTDYILAENTYKFGFHGITAGGWLADKLRTEYGMQCDSYDFGADKVKYQFKNNETRKEIFFYARPVTERRGFDLGIMALEIFHKMMPEYTINLAGWDVSAWDIPFPYNNLGAMKIEELSEVYNRCAAALVLSLTNMSLLPLELLSSGAIPVVNDAPNNRLVSNNPYIAYTEASPEALAKKLVDVVTMDDLTDYARRAANSVSSDGWEVACRSVVTVLKKALSNV